MADTFQSIWLNLPRFGLQRARCAHCDAARLRTGYAVDIAHINNTVILGPALRALPTAHPPSPFNTADRSRCASRACRDDSEVTGHSVAARRGLLGRAASQSRPCRKPHARWDYFHACFQRAWCRRASRQRKRFLFIRNHDFMPPSRLDAEGRCARSSRHVGRGCGGRLAGVRRTPGWRT
jgi:hypothetical protein